jgi:16S rRNA (guanine527-N7)-methyltransferase
LCSTWNTIDAYPENSVSRGTQMTPETQTLWRRHLELLALWQPKINLVGPATLPDAWNRHILDSAQLLPLIPPETRSIADLGSGAGFPGLVLAAALPDVAVSLYESDLRKTIFLQECVRELKLANVRIVRGRIETLPPAGVDVVTARALADLGVLCGHAHRHLRAAGQPRVALFLKGARWREELANAKHTWSFDLSVTNSLTDSTAALLRLDNLAPQ